jgi:hypothetical protein
VGLWQGEAGRVRCGGECVCVWKYELISASNLQMLSSNLANTHLQRYISSTSRETRLRMSLPTHRLKLAKMPGTAPIGQIYKGVTADGSSKVD